MDKTNSPWELLACNRGWSHYRCKLSEGYFIELTYNSSDGNAIAQLYDKDKKLLYEARYIGYHPSIDPVQHWAELVMGVCLNKILGIVTSIFWDILPGTLFHREGEEPCTFLKTEVFRSEVGDEINCVSLKTGKGYFVPYYEKVLLKPEEGIDNEKVADRQN